MPITRALREQVYKAVPTGGSELDVVTIISKPMYAIFEEETETTTPGRTRVWGSDTQVVESHVMFSWSAAIPQ